ncbi:hypothetical protein BEL04_08430 [Mucilaginibacter sp. PPCGB 2223]|uniref:hypothetical protein n=1 Tax=Mucilaginibacter sp. PPCGB 2223 TaxID=1886027 RepID=UPI0008262F09|nr:hypothetical protein [Mucilaginibacter sp. PPCGB 2223]OCX54274.1 hypothetical protein BEL04_08430 [Mucilaginibacter sp. PPCGB 2223]
MEAAIQDTLTDQVREHLKTLKAEERVREAIYGHFMPQCLQYGISEDDFYKKILKVAFREALPSPEEDPDPPNRKGTFVTLFGITLHSLKRLGTLLFEEPERAQVYFEDATLLKAHADALQDADRAIALVQLYRSEKDAEKRYLKLCYALNPALPYRIDGELFTDPRALLKAGFERRSLMNRIYKEYRQGLLQTWTELPPEPSPINFLRFIYALDPNFPFYVGKETFDTPEDLVTRAQQDLDFWVELLKSADNGSLFTWCDARGHADWRTAWESVTMPDDEHRGYALVQELLYVIAAELDRPRIESTQKEIDLPDIPATKILEVIIPLRATALGFVRAKLELSPAHAGISLNQTEVILFDLDGRTEETLILSVDPQQLQKNTEYHSVIRIITGEHIQEIPVRVLCVFPLRSFRLYLLKYSAFGAAFFGLFRWLLTLNTGQVGSLSPVLIRTEITRSLPDNYLSFYWVFVAMLTALILSVLAIRKVEKL